MVLETTGGKIGKELLRLQHCKGAGHMQSCNVPFRQVATILKFLQGAGGFFQKASPAPRRAQNLLAGCIFVGVADKSAFALLLTRVTEQRTV